MVLRVLKLGVVSAVGLGGCGFSIGAAPTVDDATIDDGAATDQAADDAATPDGPVALGPWGPPVLVPLIGAAGGDDDPSLTDDRLELYFNRLGDIYVATRAQATDPWGPPVVVSELSSAVAGETTPEVTSDGLTITITSDRAGSANGSSDIWISTRANRSAAWSTPVLAAGLNTDATEAAAAITDDLREVVLTTTRDGMSYELYASERATPTAGWGEPRALTSLNTAGSDYSPMLSPDHLTIYWDAVVAANEDLFAATRASADGNFGPPVPITELNTAAVEADPWVSADGRHIVFVSNRSGTFAMYEAKR